MARWQQIALWLVGLVSVGGVGVAITYGSAEETRLFALDSQTGRVQWSVEQLRGHHAPQVVGDRIVVSQSNYKSSPFSEFEPIAHQIPEKKCLQQNWGPIEPSWGLIAYDTTSGQLLWRFCPQTQQFSRLDLKLTPGMQFNLTRNQLHVPLLMSDFPPGQKNSDQLLAINADNGTPAWSIEQNFRQALPRNKSRNVSSELYGSSVVQVGQQVIVLTGKLGAPVTLQAFNAATGQITWKQTLPDRLEAEFSSSLEPVVRNYLLANQQQVFLVSPRKGIIALDARTGTMQFQTDGNFWGRTQITDAAFYQFEPTAVSAYATNTGKRQWQQTFPTPKGAKNYGLLGAVDQQTVYTRINQLALDGTTVTVQVFALNRNNGQQQWHKQFEMPKLVDVDIPPVVGEGGVTFIVSDTITPDQSDLQLVTLNTQSGETRWTFPLNIAGDSKAVVRVYGLMSSNSDLVFIRDHASRFHHWLAHFHFPLGRRAERPN